MRRVVDKMKCNSIIKEYQDKSKEGRDGREEWDVRFTIEIKEINSPAPATEWLFHVRTVQRPVGGTTCVATRECRGESVRDVEFFRLNMPKDTMVDSNKEENCNCHSKIRNVGSRQLVAKEW